MHLFSPVDAYLRWCSSFILRLLARPFGLVGSWFLFPLFPAVPRTVGICPLMEFFVLWGASSNNLAFQNNLEGSTLFLGILLILFVSNVFWGGSKVVGYFDANFHASWRVYYVCYSWCSLLLSPCFWSSNHSCMVVVLWDSSTLVPCVTGNPKFSEGLILNC